MILGGEDQYYQPEDDEFPSHPRGCWCNDCQDPDALRDAQGEGR